MMVDDILRKALRKLGKRATFAMAGGIVASVYRREIRATADVDLLVGGPNAAKDGERLLRDMGFTVAKATLAQLSKAPRMNKKRLPPMMLVGRDPKEPTTGLDILLPSFPWFDLALERALTNLLDFGFGPIPAMCPEDLIVAKLFALTNNPSRRTDGDDIIAILEGPQDIDIPYLAGRMESLKLPMPRDIERVAPKALRVLSKRLRRKR